MPTEVRLWRGQLRFSEDELKKLEEMLTIISEELMKEADYQKHE